MQTQPSDILAGQTSESSKNSNKTIIAEQAEKNSTTMQDRQHLVETINALGDCV